MFLWWSDSWLQQSVTSKPFVLLSFLMFFFFHCCTCLQNWQGHNQKGTTRDPTQEGGGGWFKYKRRADQAQVNVIRVISKNSWRRESYLKPPDKTKHSPEHQVMSHSSSCLCHFMPVWMPLIGFCSLTFTNWIFGSFLSGIISFHLCFNLVIFSRIKHLTNLSRFWF